ncbi:MAG TPA: alpha/beta fold hydrolase [Candidatus Polarisedimenticolaceae bacterium]|nr:alpha/beta fold hydrolase [Candidatus Polarisedimenticolaceae bacterium]
MSTAFRPVRWLPGAHLQTIVPALWPAGSVRGQAERCTVAVGGGSAVRLETHRPPGRHRGTLLLVHGLGGSAESGYMRHTAHQALERAWCVARMNLRNCGGTEALARTLYNAGQSEDVACVLEQLAGAGWPAPFAVAGFSLGGNIVLRYAGRAGGAARADAVVGINPPIDLEPCARALEAPHNRWYQRHLTAALRRQVRRIRAVRPCGGPEPGRARTVRQFDALFTAPDAGYASAEAYYADASAASVLSGLRRPGLVLSAENDPLVPATIFEPHGRVPALKLWLLPAGGHCGYWQSGRPRFWAASALLDFLEGIREFRPGAGRA